MAKFKDMHGREFEFRLSIPLIPRLRLVGFDVNDFFGSFKALSNPEAFGRVFWVLCEKDCKAKGVSEEDFADGFDGDAFERAFTALLEAKADFIQPSKVASQIKEQIPAALSTAHNQVLSTLNGDAGSLPASSDSIPAS